MTGESRRRTILVISTMGIGGAQTQLAMLAQGRVERGDDVEVVELMSAPATSAARARLDALGVPITGLDASRTSAATVARRLAHHMRASGSDVAISFMFHANVMTRLAGRAVGLRAVVSSIRNESFGGRHREVLMRATDAWAAVTTTNSVAAAERMRRRHVVSPARLVVVPNAIDVARFAESAVARARTRDDLDLGPHDLVWLTIGRLVAQKDHATLLRAVARLDAAPRSRRRRLLVVGAGPLHDALAGLAAELGLGDAVQFLGQRRDVPALLQACDGVVSSSVFEGSPNTVLEAMASARPVVATRVGGTAELVDDPGTGRLVPPGDAAALARAMSEIESLPEQERAACGARGREHAVARHSPAEVSAAWDSVIERAVNVAGSRRPAVSQS